MSNVFVFESNLAGIHGAGSALHAKKYYGAIQGEGIGRHGNSYAIPTKDLNLVSLPVFKIKPHVQVFYDYAKAHYWVSFNVVAIGCGLAGFTVDQMAPLFANPPDNVNLPEAFKAYLNNEV